MKSLIDNYDAKLKEAIKRMKMLNIHPNAIREFDKSGMVNVSKQYGALYWTSEEERRIIDEFEKKNNCLVYHAIYTRTAYGELLSLMFVSNYNDEWVADAEDIQQGYIFAYVKNCSDDFCSEFGTIGVKPINGGLMRTC